MAFVGKAPGQYLSASLASRLASDRPVMLGGGFYGQRLNKIYRESVDEAEILEILTPMIKSYGPSPLLSSAAR